METGVNINFRGTNSPVNIAGLTSKDYEASSSKSTYVPKYPLDDGTWQSSLDIANKIETLQATIDAERMKSYQVSIEKDTSGIISPGSHGLSLSFPIHFSASFYDIADAGRHDVAINHYTKDDGTIAWSLLKAYTGDQKARIDLVGKEAIPTDTEKSLMEQYAYGIQWVATVVGTASPKRVGNLYYHKSLPIQSEMKGCIWNRTDGIKYYLHPDDWSKKEDGSVSVLTGGDGDICVRIPKFYIRYVVDGTNREVWISKYKISSLWYEIPEMVIAAYKGILVGNKWRSAIFTDVNGNVGSEGSTTTWYGCHRGKSRVSYSRANMRTACRNNGMELLNYEYYKAVFYWLPVIEYNCFNSQSNAVVNADYTPKLDDNGFHQGMFGAGTTNISTNIIGAAGYCIFPIGFGIGNLLSTRTVAPLPATYNSIHKGNTTWIMSFKNSDILSGEDSTVNTYISYRGLAQPFGELWQNIDGIVFQGGNVYSTTDPSLYTKLENVTSVSNGEIPQIGTCISSSGVYGGVHYSNTNTQKIELFPSATGGSSTSGLYDVFWTNKNGTTLYTLLLGGASGTGARAGLASFYSGDVVSNPSANVGGRSYQLL